MRVHVVILIGLIGQSVGTSYGHWQGHWSTQIRRNYTPKSSLECLDLTWEWGLVVIGNFLPKDIYGI